MSGPGGPGAGAGLDAGGAAGSGAGGAAGSGAGAAPYRLVAYDVSQRDAYLGLLHEAWGEGSMSGAELDWWFGGNPAGSLISTAEIDGRVVGVAGHSLARLRLGGAESLGQFSVHATTARAARGLGIFQALELRHEEQGSGRGSQVALVFANTASSPLFRGPLGWTSIDQGRVWVRPFARAARRLVGRSGPAGLPPAGDAGQPARGVEIQRLARFGAETDAAYCSALPGLANHVVRDATYLNWRYVASPRGYRVFASPSGFAVLGHKRHRGVSLAFLAECVGPPREVRALIRHCSAEARGGAEALALLPPAGLSRAALLALGFLPSHISLDFLGKPLAGPLATVTDAWSGSLGDADFF